MSKPKKDDPQVNKEALVEEIEAQWNELTDKQKAEITANLSKISDIGAAAANQIAEFSGKFKDIGAAVNQSIGKWAEAMAPLIAKINEYYEANRDIIDRLDEWPALTGLTMDELDQMELHEVIALVRQRTANQIQAADTLELVVVDTAIIKPRPGGAISQAQGTISAVELYMKLPQARHSNQMTHALATNIKKGLEAKTVQLDSYGTATITGPKFKLHIAGYLDLIKGVSGASAAKLLDIIHKTCWGTRDTLFKMPLRDYMELRGMADIKTAREQINGDLQVLKSVSVEYQGHGRDQGHWFHLALYGGFAQIKNSVIYFRLTPEYYASIPEDQFAYIPHILYATDDRNHPNAFYFGRAICVAKRMNLGSRRENIIGIKELLASSPNLPKKQDVGNKWRERILERFERDMDYIQELTQGGINWSYQDTEPPIDTYNQFENANVIITWTNYPEDETKQLRANKQRALKKSKTKKPTQKRGLN